MIDISGYDKADVLIVLYEHARVQGRGFLQATTEPMSKEEANDLLEEQTDFDYLHGRVMKVDLSGNSFDPRLYDRDNGDGTAQRAIDSLKESEG